MSAPVIMKQRKWGLGSIGFFVCLLLSVPSSHNLRWATSLHVKFEGCHIVTVVCRQELFYLFHLRSCAACAAGANVGGSSRSLEIAEDCGGVLRAVIGLLRGLSWLGSVSTGFIVWGWQLPGRALTCAMILSCPPSSYMVGIGLGLVLLARGYRLHLPLVWCRTLSCLGLLLLSWEHVPTSVHIGMHVYTYFHPAFPAEGSQPMDLDPAPLDPVDAELRHLFGEHLSAEELLQLEAGPAPALQQVRSYGCPVQGCCRHVSGGRPGWKSFAAMRAHVDMHLGGELRGRPPDSWFTDCALTCCKVCGRTLSNKVQGGVHPSCWRSMPAGSPGLTITTHDSPDEPLPSVQDVFTTPIFTKDFIPAALIPIARTEYTKLVAAVLALNRADAWDPLPLGEGGKGIPDSPAHQAAREAWISLLMFPKCTLRQFKRGQRPGQALHFTKALLLRWRMGERAGLWREAVGGQRRGPVDAGGRRSEKQGWNSRVQEVERLTGLGRISQALSRLTSPGLAANTAAVRSALLAKFPAIPGARQASARHPPPPPGLIEMPVFLRALRSFAVGVGPGPDGLRADFLKALVGVTDDDPILHTLRDFAQLLADGGAPTYLRPWLAGGQLIGVGKHDSLGRPIPLDTDARPIVMGVTWRKLVFKCTLQMDRATLRERLLPHQLAVGVSCGAEAMLHATREWVKTNSHKQDVVLLQTDVSNAFNTVLPEQFLQDAVEHAPASARFAEYCYGEPTRLVYRGELAWCERGQQGCPMMGPLFCLSRCRMLREAQQASSRPMPEFRPAFADDGFSGGPVLDVWEQFRQEIRLADAYGLKVDPSKCTLYLLAGEAFRGDVSRFQALGVKVVTGANILMLKTPISQDAEFLHSFQKSKCTELECVFEALERLPRHHVAFTLMRQGVSYGKIQYWCRTVPRAHLGELLDFFHLRAKHALEHMLNVTLNSQQWTQAKLPLDMGGLGLASPPY